ncbi:hypothetical protein CDR68_24090 [Salmonella enterica]|nr:hypothetical protein [Salmonella enterica]
MRILFFYILLVIPFFSYADENFGTWNDNCDNVNFSIQLEKTALPLIINDNQIVISIHAVSKNNRIDVFFDNTLDLGRGGMSMNWADVDKSKKIAEMIIHDKIGYFKWLGFYDKKTNKYFWVSKPDFSEFYSEGNIIRMVKCN